MANSTTPALVERNYVLVDPTRYPEPQLTGIRWARRESVAHPVILGVSDPTPHWFAQASLAVPSEDQLAAFARDGIVRLRQAPVGTLPYNARKFADIAVDTAVAAVDQRYDNQAARMDAPPVAARERIRAAAVLAHLDGLTPDARSNAFVEAFGRSPEGQTSLDPFTQLRHEHPTLLAEALDRSWTERRIKLERNAAIDAQASDVRHPQPPAQAERQSGLRGVWSRFMRRLPRR